MVGRAVRQRTRGHRIAAVVAVLVGAMLAGCATPEGEPTSDTGAPRPEGTAMALLAADGVVAASEGRAQLVANGTCDGRCSDLRLSVDVAAIDTDTLERLFVTVAWDGTTTPGFDLASPSADDDRRGHDADRLTFEAPLPADVALELNGSGDYTLRARLVFSDGDHGRLLPNLITTTPGGFLEPGEEPPEPFNLLYDDNCAVHDERREQGAERCLRFANAPGNVGQGPLEVRMELTEGPQAVTGQGQYIQRVLRDDGTWESQAVAGGVFHTTHAHMHYVGFSDYRLYEYDLETGLRGAQVGDSNKVGFCPIDFDPVPDSEVDAAPKTYTQEACYAPSPEGWFMGISKGRYDIYGPALSGQYVEISGVADGIYQLVSVADMEDTLEEESEHDNAASVVLRLGDGGAEVLDAFSLYGLVPELQ